MTVKQCHLIVRFYFVHVVVYDVHFEVTDINHTICMENFILSYYQPKNRLIRRLFARYTS